MKSEFSGSFIVLATHASNLAATIMSLDASGSSVLRSTSFSADSSPAQATTTIERRSSWPLRNSAAPFSLSASFKATAPTFTKAFRYSDADSWASASIPCQPAKYLLSDFGQGRSAGYFVAKLMRFCHAPGRSEPRSAFGWGFRR